MKFQRKDNHTVMRGLVIRYQRIHSALLEVSASRDGVCFSGDVGPLMGSDLSELRAVICAAEQQYRNMANNEPLVPFEDDPHCVIQLIDGKFLGDGKVLKTRK